LARGLNNRPVRFSFFDPALVAAPNHKEVLEAGLVVLASMVLLLSGIYLLEMSFNLLKTVYKFSNILHS
jgi:hypothetical protein